MDPAAFEDLMKRHQRQVLMTAQRMLGNMADAQDAAQEVFYRLYKYRDRADVSRDLSPWLYRMTVNVCHDLRRRQPDVALEGDLPDLPAIEEELDFEGRREILRQALKHLPEKERAAIVLRDIEGLETSEVAGILGSSETTVRSQVSMGRARLREICSGLMRRKV